MASLHARSPRAQPPISTERLPAARVRPLLLVLLARCRGVWAAGGTSRLDPALAVQCREPFIAGGKEGKALIVSAQRPSSWQPATSQPDGAVEAARVRRRRLTLRG